MIEVTKEAFYQTVGPLDVVVNVKTDGSDFELRNRTLIGRCVGSEGHYWDADKKYFLVNR